ncbi:MAG: aspartyl/asparaginyl beta-hydroxylase domain-containing protein, partial [Solirubrobacteraceae bacterium]
MSTLRERVVEGTVAFGERALPPLERWLGSSSLVGDQPFFDNDTFPWAARLEANWRDIRAELDAVLE